MPATHSDFANSLIHIEKMFSKKSLFGIIFWLLLAGTSVTLVTLTGLYLYLSPKLPSVETLREIKLQTPLRVYSSDGKLIGEFGEQRRTPLTYDQIPPLYIKALLSAEDAEFFEHHGVSLKGMLRAASQILKSGAIQSGGSTITQQLARDFFSLANKSSHASLTKSSYPLKLKGNLPRRKSLSCSTIKCSSATALTACSRLRRSITARTSTS
jgi:penicillin-binding protein 1A